jgi:4-aminobutyrate aminotransferase
VIDAVPANSISTFGGNPLSCVGALATLDVLRRDDLQGNALKRGAQLAEGLHALAARHDWIAEVRGKGLMLAIEVCHPGGIDPWNEAAAQLMEATRDRGLLVGKGGLYGNVVRITPPLSVTEAEVAEALQLLGAAAEEVGR